MLISKLVIRSAWVVFTTLAVAVSCGGEDAMNEHAERILNQYCIDCHDASTAEGDLVLALGQSAWTGKGSVEKWESVHQMVAKGIMPPADADQPDDAETKAVLDWLDQWLIENSPIGGTPLRRLSGREYANTISQIFGLPDYQLPPSFPPDNELHGFDNQGEALVIAASHLEAFAESASQIADEFFPPSQKAVESRAYVIPADELVISYSSACLIDGAMRLASSGANEVRHATWPTKFEAPASGIYEVEVTASSFDPRSTPDHVPQLRFRSTQMSGHDVADQKDLSVPTGPASTYRFQIGLDRGATLKLRYANGPLDYENRSAFPKFLKAMFLSDPNLAAAWDKVGDPARGGNGWERLKDVMKAGDLDKTPFVKESEALTELVSRVSKNAVKSGETIVYKFFEEGPYIAIDGMTIVGPITEYLDRDQQKWIRQREGFIGDSLDGSDRPTLRRFMSNLLTKIFRRTALDSEIESYVNLVTQEMKSSGSFDRGMHLAIRAALISPAFLYRSVGPGELNDFELASRLSYFLTSGPPDDILVRLAREEKLGDQKTLRKQTRRLLRNSKQFGEDFTDQWLGLAALDRLMPDTRLIQKFTAAHRQGMRDEVTLTFREVLDNNRSVVDFIAPDHLFTNRSVGWDIYKLPEFKPVKKGKGGTVKNDMQRVEVDREGRFGGLLAMPAIMMATANGVDTQPVLRGVWLLENIMGTPPPNPPKAVPALTPDTTGATSPKARLAAHTAEASCAACHREIDPLGFVLENFDPIGRWRDFYPRFVDRNGKSKMIDGSAIDATGILPGGTPLGDVRDLKKWLAQNPEPFARCLCEKLLTYATGRTLNYRERSVVADIVTRQRNEDLKFADLVVELVDSEIFRMK